MNKLSLLLSLLLVATLWSGCRNSTVTKIETFPKPAASIARMQDWPLEYLVKHEIIFGNTPVENVKDVIELAKRSGYEDWAEKVIIIQEHCWQTLDVRILKKWPIDTTKHLPKWMYQMGENNPHIAIRVAAWENLKMGVDWWLRDTEGRLVPLWPTWRDINLYGKPMQHCVANWAPDCPVGKWNGCRVIGKQQFYLGNTKGLTLLQWMYMEMKKEVILGSDIFTEYVDGILLEDGGFIGVPCWAMPDTLRLSPQNNGEGMNCREYRQHCMAGYETYMQKMVGGLNKKLFFYINGHHTKEELKNSLEYQLVYKYCNAPKVEHYGNWGGWPHIDTPEWLAIWPKIEDRYIPYGFTERSILDRVQGDNMAIAQCTPLREWRDTTSKRWVREHLAMTLINSSAYFSVSFKEDHSGYGYMQGQYVGWPNIDGFETPYLYYKIGSPVSEMKKNIDPRYPQFPLYYRYFEDSKKRYTVVVNMWPRTINMVPQNDGVWFEGIWPNGKYEQIVLQQEHKNTEWR